MFKVENDAPCGIKGAYSYQVINDSDGKVLMDVSEQSNLILDGWLDVIKNTGEVIPETLVICIGTGAQTPPTYQDTDLNNQVKAVGYSPNRLVYAREILYGIDSHAATVNFSGFTEDNFITEVGIRKNNSTGVLITRALLKDDLGNPVSVKIGEGQTLRLTYTLFSYWKMIVSEGVFYSPFGDIHYIATYTNIGTVGKKPPLTSINSPYINKWYGSYEFSHIYIDNIKYYTPLSVTVANGTMTNKLKLNAGDVSPSDRPIGSVASSNTYKGKHICGFIGRPDDQGVKIYMLVDSNETRPILPSNQNIELTYTVSWGRIIE